MNSTKPDIQSAVITQWPKGYVAHLRFTDPKLDTDISHNSRAFLHRLIESYLYKKIGFHNATITVH